MTALVCVKCVQVTVEAIQAGGMPPKTEQLASGIYSGNSYCAKHLGEEIAKDAKK